MQGGNHGNHFLQENASPELEHRAKKAGDKFSETLHVIANEPSLAFFRIQEHVRKSLPQLVNKKHEVQDLQQDIQGATFDMEYATKAVSGMERSKVHFLNIQEQLKNAMFIRQQIKYEQSRRVQERNRPSMYHMLRTQTVDLTGSNSTNRHSADLSRGDAGAGGDTAESGVEPTTEDSPRARSSSLSSSSNTWVSPAALMR